MAKKQKLEQNDVVSPPEAPPPPPPTISHVDLLQIIKPFTHQQLSEIVITACLRHHDVIESIRSIADVNPSRRSLSIQNLDQSTTIRKLTSVFAEFGEVETAKVVRGKISRKCKGYVVYKHVDSALLALKEPSKLIDGKISVVKLVDDVEKSKKTVDVSLRRVYVENVSKDVDCEKLLECFKKYGEIEEGRCRFDKGFAFIVYKNVEGVNACLVDPVKFVDGREMHCRLDVSKEGDSMTVDVSLRRIYVGNVPAEMDCGKLLEHFEMYGEVEDGPLGFDEKTGKFKGFAFVVYRNVEGVKACLVDPVKVVDGHELSCRLASIMKRNVTSVSDPHAGEAVNLEHKILKMVSSKNEIVTEEKSETVDVSLRRVYVGNVPSEMDCEKLLEHFLTYGEVEEGPLGFDTKTGQFKGSAFIVYKNLYGVRACLVEPVKIIDGHKLDCRLAVSKQGDPNGVDALQAGTAAQVAGLGDTELVISKQKSSKKVDVSLRKVCISPTEMNCEKLLEHFSMYGEIEGGLSGIEKKKSKFGGFAFIIYKNVDGAKACLADPVKIIDGEEMSCRLASPRKGQVASAAPALGSGVANSNLETYVSLRRVYISNVPAEMKCEKLLEHFLMYGEIERPTGFEKKKGKFRGSAFIIYKNVDGAKACLVDPVKIIDGHELSCRLAIHRKGQAASGAPALGSGVANSNLETVDVSSGRVYVGNVPPELNREKLLAHFRLYGKVAGFHMKARFKGFSLVVYKNVEGAKACLVDPVKTIDGYQLHCKPGIGNPSIVNAPVATAAQVQGSDSTGKRKFVNSDVGPSGVSDFVGNMGGTMATAAQVQGSDNRGKRKFVNSELQSSMNIPFAGGGYIGVSHYVGNMDASVATAAQLQGSDNKGKREFVNPEQQSSMKCPFAGGGHSGVSDYVGNMGATVATAAQVQGSDNRGKQKSENLEQQNPMQSSFAGVGHVSHYVGRIGSLGLPAGPYAYGISGYGGGGHGQPSEHSKHLVNLNLGGGFGLTSSLSSPGLLTNVGEVPSYLRVGTSSDGSHVGLGTVYGGVYQRPQYVILPSSVRMTLEGYAKSAPYGLPFGFAHPTQQP